MGRSSEAPASVFTNLTRMIRAGWPGLTFQESCCTVRAADRDTYNKRQPAHHPCPDLRPDLRFSHMTQMDKLQRRTPPSEFPGRRSEDDK